MSLSIEQAAQAACLAIGIDYKDVPHDGLFHTANISNDARGRNDGRLKIFADRQGGIAWNHRSGERQAFFINQKNAASMTDADRAKIKAEQLRRKNEIKAKQNKSINLAKLPALINHMIVMSVIFASIFLIFILQQWKFIAFNAELRSQYHLPGIFIAYQLEKELSDIGQRVPDDIASLYMAQMMSEYNIGMQAQTQFSYQRKILGDLLAKLDELQAQQDLASFLAAYQRLERSLVILLDTLIQNETALRIESAAINIDLQQAKITVEQFRRLHERSASYVEMVGQEASNRMVWSVSILGITLLFMWSIVIVRSSGVVRGAIITQQQSEQKITESQQLLEAILNHATACIYLKDLEGKEKKNERIKN